MNKEPYKVLEEHIKSNFICLNFYLNNQLYTFSVITSIGDGGIGRPGIGPYQSFEDAKQAALRYVLEYHKSEKQKSLLKCFKMLDDLDQPGLFD
jgi:hypothetical protein